MASRSWGDILSILSSLITFKQRADGKNWRDAFDNMPIYLERAGLALDLHKLSVIHVAGTKGKGSTCAMTESILRSSGYRTGLFTSPHLVDVRERIRINGHLVSREVFSLHFWQLYDRLHAAATPEVGVPGYFRFITLLGFKIFLAEGVDVALLEVGLGGRLDATNVVRHPVVCAITALGMDHMELLGDTLPKIAAEKAGIMKPGVPVFSSPQEPDAIQVLHDVASRVGTSLEVPSPFSEWRLHDGRSPPALGLAGSHQESNAALAIQLAAAWEERSAAAAGCRATGRAQRLTLLGKHELPPEYAQGLASVSWPGRSQVIHDDEFCDSSSSHPPGNLSACTGATPVSGAATGSRLSFYLDGAHTPESMATCGAWFAQALETHAPSLPAVADGCPQDLRVLIFNCMKEREGAKLLPPLADALQQRSVAFSHAFFVPTESQYGSLKACESTVGGTATISGTATQSSTSPASQASPTEPSADLSWQRELQGVWDAHLAAAALRRPPQQHSKGGAQHSNGSAQHSIGSGAQLGSGTALPSLITWPGLAISPGRSHVGLSLSQTLDGLRRCLRQAPHLRVQVLITGSLYLVGDVLRLLGKPPL